MPKREFFRGDRFRLGDDEYILAFTTDIADKRKHYFQLISIENGNRFSDTVIRHDKELWPSITEEQMRAICEGEFDCMIYIPKGERPQ